MTLEQYWFAMQKQWKLILACLAIVGLGTFVVSMLMTPIYQSSAIVQVVFRSANSQSDYTSLLASDQLVQTEAQLATSDVVLREVTTHYHDLSTEQLLKKVTVVTKLNTQLFEIDVQDPSPVRAAALANDVAATLIKQQRDVTLQDNNRSQQRLQQDLDATRKQIDEVTTKIAALQNQGGKQGQIAVLQAQLGGLQQHYTQWQTVLAQLELTEAQSEDFLRVAQPAQPGVSPVRPLIVLNTAAGLAVGLVLGIISALLFERLDTRVRTPEALTQYLGWPILAIIWRANTTKGEAVVHPQGRQANVESYRILRTNVGFSSIDKPMRFLGITSAIPQDGKSVVAANLAIFMAKAGKNTLLIDADLRYPTVHDKFKLPADKMGLSNAIMACSQLQFFPLPSAGAPGIPTLSLDPYMHNVGVANLRVMPSGPLPPNPPELLDSKAMERFFTALANSGAEAVIFDTPPLLGLSDTSILASRMDGMLVVVDITRANRSNLKQVKANLTQAGAQVLGCVVNKARRPRKDVNYSYYYADEQPADTNTHAKNGHVPAIPSQIASTTTIFPPRTPLD